MATRLTAEQCFARAYALQEAAEHLGMSWTEDPTEFEQGKVVAAALRAQADQWLKLWLERGGNPANL